ncbi:hypothetical protein FRC12_025026 [Ceratobasidium sp. 428]|nr:hypothetical protein FRC12_025026 [Ceratobasidium sp. 428]
MSTNTSGTPMTASQLAKAQAKDVGKQIRHVREAALSMLLSHPYICGMRKIITHLGHYSRERRGGALHEKGGDYGLGERDRLQVLLLPRRTRIRRRSGLRRRRRIGGRGRKGKMPTSRSNPSFAGVKAQEGTKNSTRTTLTQLLLLSPDLKRPRLDPPTRLLEPSPYLLFLATLVRPVGVGGSAGEKPAPDVAKSVFENEVANGLCRTKGDRRVVVIVRCHCCYFTGSSSDKSAEMDGNTNCWFGAKLKM